MSLYFIILLASVAVPLGLSFDRNIQFYKQWKHLFPALFSVAIVYIVFDVFFTRTGVWGFNERYLSGLIIAGLPIEEILFFIIIPYCSIFLYDTVEHYFPKIKLSEKTTLLISIVLIGLAVTLLILFFDKAYTAYMSLTFLFSVALGLRAKNKEILQRFYLVFILITIPFMIVNGLLTGSFIDEEVVWYSSSEIMGLRLFTIPVEDFGYGFGLIFYNLLLREWIKNHTN